MVKDKTVQLSGLQGSIINIISELVEFRDVITGAHISRTQKYVELLINRLIERNIYSEEILMWEDMDHVVPATLLHDLGKIFISDTILNKPEKLTSEEFEIMKTHVVRGVEAIKRLEGKGVDPSYVKYAEVIAGTHHERWDGKGYPAALTGEEIPLLGRVMALADVYDALTSSRPYKEPYSTDESAQIIIDNAGTHFDPVLVDIFKEVEKEFASIATSDM